MKASKMFLGHVGTLFLLQLTISSARTFSSAKRLYDDLMMNVTIPHLRPVLNQSDTVYVKTKLFLLGIYSFDVSAQVLKLTCTGRLHG